VVCCSLGDRLGPSEALGCLEAASGLFDRGERNTACPRIWGGEQAVIQEEESLEGGRHRRGAMTRNLKIGKRPKKVELHWGLGGGQ